MYRMWRDGTRFRWTAHGWRIGRNPQTVVFRTVEPFTGAVVVAGEICLSKARLRILHALGAGRRLIEPGRAFIHLGVSVRYVSDEREIG